jgi:transposase InsO family protein
MFPSPSKVQRVCCASTLSSTWITKRCCGLDSWLMRSMLERVWQRRYANPAEAVVDINHYIVAFYNTHRLHSTLGYRSPADFEKASN